MIFTLEQQQTLKPLDKLHKINQKLDAHAFYY
jgi:hypothetical protein